MIKLGHLELRFINTLSNEEKYYLEIVQWDSETLCFTIASWSTDKNGDFPSLEYCMDRPLADGINKDDFDELVKIGYSIYSFREIKNEDLL